MALWENQLAERLYLSQRLLAIYIHIVVQAFAAKYETLGKDFVVAQPRRIDL